MIPVLVNMTAAARLVPASTFPARQITSSFKIPLIGWCINNSVPKPQRREKEKTDGPFEDEIPAVSLLPAKLWDFATHLFYFNFFFSYFNSELTMRRLHRGCSLSWKKGTRIRDALMTNSVLGELLGSRCFSDLGEVLTKKKPPKKLYLFLWKRVEKIVKSTSC